jgi:restriction system protein
LPWWGGVALAVISYFWLHHIAIAALAPMPPGQIGAGLSQVLYKGLATAGQFIVPLVCILGALTSAWRRHQRASLFANTAQSKSVSALNDMSWQEFELLVGEAFRRGGFAVVETGGGGADGGVDLVLRKDGEKYLVQCKQWRAYKVSVPIIRELYGAMAASGVAGGFVVTSGVFTQDAKDFAAGRNIELVDGTELNEIIQRVRPQAVTAQATPHFTPKPSASPNCPACGSAMVRRTAKKGVNAGNEFWGCGNYPQCRGIVPID